MLLENILKNLTYNFPIFDDIAFDYRIICYDVAIPFVIIFALKSALVY